MSDVTVVMISCVQREAARRETIPQLLAVGLRPSGGLRDGPHLSPCSPHGTNYGNAEVSKRALDYAKTQARACLFVEDDIDVDLLLFPRMLAQALTANRVTYFYVHDGIHNTRTLYGDSIHRRLKHGAPITPHLRELGTNETLHHAQCVLIPHADLQRIDTNEMLTTKTPIDKTLTRYLQSRNERPLVALPHPVQHRNVRVARWHEDGPDPRNTSFSFGLWRS